MSELLELPLFKDLSEESIYTLCFGANLRSTSHREILFERGDPAVCFGVVLSGAYKLTRINPLGEEAVVHFSAYGDVVGALILSQPNSVYPVTSTAMGPSRALLIPRETYLKSWAVNSLLLSKVHGLFSSRIGRFQTQKTMQRSPLTAKVATILLQIVTNSSHSNEYLVPMPITRREIADSLGVTVESVIRVMSEWEKLGIIQTDDQNIRVLQPNLLIQQVNTPPK